MNQGSKQLMKGQKGMVIVSGIPASGKSYFAKQLFKKFLSDNIQSKIFSTDNLEAFIFENSTISIDETINICSKKEWDQILSTFSLDKQNFDQKAWNMSRKMIQDPQIIDLLIGSCQILIIEDDLALKSQRKPFKRYCFQRKVRYLEIQIQATLQEAYFNNQQRGNLFPRSKVTQQVIKKSFQKYQHNEYSIVLTRNRMKQFLESSNFYSCMKYVQIEDNYSQYLMKKSVQHEFTQKELDENELRKLINLIMKDQKESQKYFKNPIQTKDKASILAQAKKSYIEQKRKVPFIEILCEIIAKKKQKIQQ